MMSLWDALRMNMMISYQELVRTFLKINERTLPDKDKPR
ncbi:ydjO [Escherichia coli]|nr:ydjO [Escherichia coli]